MALVIVPLTLKQANELIARWHRHHKPVIGHRFSIGVMERNHHGFCDGELMGAAIIGRPVARGCEPYSTAEITRLVTNRTKNACSMLYGAAARICKEMGFEKIQTYILLSEPGTSLQASGWVLEAETKGGDWNSSKAYSGTRRKDQPMGPKQRWARQLRKLS